jgi:hypothetical protein
VDEFADEIETEIALTMQQISTAAGRRDLNAVEQGTKKAAELTAIKDQHEASKSRVRTLKSGSQFSSPPVRTLGAIRELAMHVTQGMITQNLLTLTEPVKQGKIRVGERLSIEALPSHDRFQTELLGSGKKLRERGKIAKFYRDAGVHAGDVVLLIEITPGQWQLRKSGSI